MTDNGEDEEHKVRAVFATARQAEVRLEDAAYRKRRDARQCAVCEEVIEDREGPAVLVVCKPCVRKMKEGP